MQPDSGYDGAGFRLGGARNSATGQMPASIDYGRLELKAGGWVFLKLEKGLVTTAFYAFYARIFPCGL